MKFLINIGAFLLLLTIISCGSDNSGNSSSVSTIPTNQDLPNDTASTGEAQPLEGKYEAILRPLNTSVSGFIPSGKAKIKISDGMIEVLTYLEDDSKVKHVQKVYQGSRCPNPSDDKNQDGFVDVQEMIAATGEELIPLDNDLSSIINGADLWPIGKAFTYERNAQVETMMKDLYDNTKLNQGAQLNLAGRVVIIHGTADLARVPESVKSINDLPRNLTIPITCGILKRM